MWAALGGLIGAALQGLRQPERGVTGALASGLNVAALAVLAAALVEASFGDSRSRRWDGLWPAWLDRVSGSQLAALGGAMIALTLARTPHRMAANAIGYALLAVIAIWAAQHRGGPRAARAAGLAVALLGLVPTHVNLPTAPHLPIAETGSAYIWSAGWPAAGWALRHQLVLEQPLDRAHMLIVSLAGPASAEGPDVRVRLNDVDVGTMRNGTYDRLELLVPAERLTGQRRLSFELVAGAARSDLRVVAHRWVGGASLGRASSAYFDGRAWHEGTFDDAAGLARAGIYAIELQPQ